jgi:hypothetical protein
MREYGLFNDEGCVERGFWSMAKATDGSAMYGEADDVHVGEVCSECEGEVPFCECENGDDDE